MACSRVLLGSDGGGGHWRPEHCGGSLTQVGKLVGTPKATPPPVTSQSHTVTSAYRSQAVGCPGVRGPVMVLENKYVIS